MAGTFTGTSYYMAPERIRGLPYTITSDVWSLGLTVLEVASNRFPFPPEGEPALGPIDLLSYIVSMKVPELKDDAASGVKWTRIFKDFLENCLEKDGTKRYGPIKMLNHPFMKKSITRNPQPNIAKFVADVWGWDYEEEESTTSSSSLSHKKPIIEPTLMENVDVPGLGRVASIRKAPSPLIHGSSDSVRAVPSRLPSLAPIPASTISNQVSSPTIDAEGRTATERAQAKQREADVGLIGSPVEEF
jgi:mitogen-activated protein kinase kinase